MCRPVLFVYVCLSFCLSVCLHVCMYVQVCIYIYMYIYIHLKRGNIHTYIYIYIYIYIWNEEIKSKTSGKIYMKTKYEIFLQWNIKLFLQKVLFLLHFGSCQFWALVILSQKFTRNFGINELWALDNHVLVNMLLRSSHFTEVH